MKHLLATLFVLCWIPVQAQEVDNIGRLANALSMQTECTWVPNEEAEYIFDCGEYHDYELFKMQISTFLMVFDDVHQTIGWTKVEQGQYAMAFAYEGDHYAVVYLADYRHFGISKIEE